MIHAHYPRGTRCLCPELVVLFGLDQCVFMMQAGRQTGEITCMKQALPGIVYFWHLDLSSTSEWEISPGWEKALRVIRAYFYGEQNQETAPHCCLNHTSSNGGICFWVEQKESNVTLWSTAMLTHTKLNNSYYNPYYLVKNELFQWLKQYYSDFYILQMCTLLKYCSNNIFRFKKEKLLLFFLLSVCVRSQAPAIVSPWWRGKRHEE